MKQKEKCDEYIYITASEQSEYFKVMFLAGKLVFPNIEGKLVHRAHGMMRFAEGKMSSRLGNVVTGESLLMGLTDVAKEKMMGRKVSEPERVAEQVAVGAIKYVVLKQNTGKDIVFDQEKSLSTEGDSGPYLQYAHVRATSLIRVAETAKEVVIEASDVPTLARIVLHYPDAVARAATELEPHHVTTYLTELASAFNSWYAAERAIVDGKISQDTLTLIKAVKNILENGLEVLAISAPEEM